MKFLDIIQTIVLITFIPSINALSYQYCYCQGPNNAATTTCCSSSSVTSKCNPKPSIRTVQLTRKECAASTKCIDDVAFQNCCLSTASVGMVCY